MYRTSSHEPRYKRSTRKGRHDESREAYENSTSEEESTESETEESCESPESRGSESIQRESLYSAESSYHQRKQLPKQNVPDSFVTSHFCHSRVLKHDKITQKNLLSPFPSFTIPPIYRELAGPAYRGHSGKSNKEKHTEALSCGRAPKHSSKRQESDDEKEDSICYIHKTCQRKGYDKYRGQKDHGSHQSPSHRPERILTCVNASSTIEPSVKGFPDMSPVKNPTPVAAPAPSPPVPLRRPKTADMEATSSKCQESRGRSRRKSAAETTPFMVDQTLPGEMQEAGAFVREKRSRKVGDDGSGEVREKLVYVVEEKGKNVSKVETDLFTLNEILAIKKDLLELSEFAKKLKKLKEMKKEAETGANHQTPCQCKPPAELLKDVNRRIEALEARQEELERGSKSEQKGHTETVSKKTTNGKKTSLDSQSKTPVAVKASAMTPIPSFPKIETLVSRTDNFSNNSDIVNELMDIKTQLHKLEQKRMSKSVLETPPPTEDLKVQKKEEHAIAVFSSKTYILTDTFDKRKREIKAIDEEKLNNYCSTVEEAEGSRKEQTKEHVANWLRNVSSKNQERAYLSPSAPKRDDTFQRGNERKNDLKCKNCSQVLKVDDFQNQEPQKNRATEKDGRAESDLGFVDTRKHDFPGKRPSQVMKYKECIVTPSGKIFACVNCFSGKISEEAQEEGRPKSAQPPSLQHRLQGNEITDVSCSIPSAVLVKECVQKLKTDFSKKRYCVGLLPRIIHSKSVQELSVNSSKTEKTARNTNLKNIDKMAQQKEKKHKDGKNQYLKLLEANLVALKKTLKRDSTTTSSCTHSEFLASVNLDTATTSTPKGASRLQGSGDNKAMVMAYSATIRDDADVFVDDCFEERKSSARAEQKRRKRREAECRKILKRKLKQQKQCEAVERKRKRQQHKYEIKLLKERCKDLKNEKCVPKNKSRSLDNYTPDKRSVEIVAPKKSKSSEEFLCKKSQGSDEGISRKISVSEECICRRKHRPVEERQRKCYCEPKSASRCRRYEEEDIPRNRRYREEEFDDRYREDVLRKYYEKEDVPREYYEKEDVPRRYYEKEDVPRKYYEKEDVPRNYYEKEDVPRRYHEKEEIQRRVYEKQDVPRKHRYDVEEDGFSRRYKEDPAGRNYSKQESSRRQFDGCYIPPKKVVCEQISRKPKREFKEDNYQRSSEEPSEVSQCIKSEDSWRLYKERQEEQLRKLKYNMSKQPSDSCKLKNLIKNIGLLKLNFPFAGEFCDGRHKNCKKSRTLDRQKRDNDDKLQWNFSQSNFNEDEDNEGDCEEDNRTYCENHSNNTNQQLHYSHHHHFHADNPVFPGSCRCVRVFLQSQDQKGWSGLGPFRKISSDSATEMTSSKTGESSKSYKNNFGLPKIKTPVFQVGYSCHDKDSDKCQRKDDKCQSKCRKKRDKCERKRDKRKHKKHKCKCKKSDDCCKCKKCGNIHRRGCRPPPCSRPPEPCKKEPTPGSPAKEPVKCEESVPLLSYLTHFRKSRPRDPKKANFLKKLDEVRYLKMCATMGRKPSKRQNWSKPSNMSSNFEEKCNCRSKLTEIESRLSMLENTKDDCVEKCCKKKNKKHKKKHKCKCTDCCGTEFSDCRRKDSDGCHKKECNDYDKKGCNECEKSGCNECEKKGWNECDKKGCNEFEKKECGGECPQNKCSDCKKENKKNKKKCFYDDCCPQSASEECHEKKKKRKKHRCNCDECEGRELPCGQGPKPCEPRPKPCETAAYYHTILCPSDTKNNSSFTETSKSSTVDEKESTESIKVKDEPPQKEQRMKEEVSSLHSFWRNLRKYSINHGRNGVETLMKKIRGKKSSCTLEPDISMVDDLRKNSSTVDVRQTDQLELRTCGKSQNKGEEMKKEKRERKNPEKLASKPHRKRHE